MNHLPYLDSAFTRVIQYERYNGLAIDNEEDQIMINVVDGKRFNGKGRGSWSGKICTYYGKSGHTIDTCYHKHGFSPISKFKGTNNSSANYTAGGDDFDTKSEGPTSARDQSVATSVKDQSVATLTQEEYKALMSLLHSNFVKASSGNQALHLINQACSVIEKENYREQRKLRIGKC